MPEERLCFFAIGMETISGGREEVIYRLVEHHTSLSLHPTKKEYTDAPLEYTSLHG
jgi:hypothetical protein